MRRALAAVCLVLPACLSGFSEIRIARPDAGTVDSARVDTPAPADAPQSPSDALDALVVPDAQVTPMDTPEVAVPVDVVAGPDVHDVGAVGVDVQDVPGELPYDASELADRVDVVVASDVATVFDVQCPTALCNGVCVNTGTDPAHCGRCGNSCSSGEVCERGRCGRWRFRELVSLSGSWGTTDGLVNAMDQQCARSGSGVPCPGDSTIVLAAAASARVDGGICRWINTREVVEVRTGVVSPMCWSCSGSPQPPSVCGEPVLACCGFESR